MNTTYRRFALLFVAFAVVASVFVTPKEARPGYGYAILMAGCIVLVAMGTKELSLTLVLLGILVGLLTIIANFVSLEENQTAYKMILGFQVVTVFVFGLWNKFIAPTFTRR
jgi:hypothetical protein